MHKSDAKPLLMQIKYEAVMNGGIDQTFLNTTIPLMHFAHDDTLAAFWRRPP